MYFDNFTIREVLRYTSDSEKLQCISNGYLDSLLILVQFLDCFRDYLEQPIVITSSFRSSEHNEYVGGSPTSQHKYGQAIDFACYQLRYDELVDKFKEFCRTSALAQYLGQVIIYPNKRIIHVALRNNKYKQLTYFEL